IHKGGTNGNVCLFTSSATQLIADVNGYSLNSPTSGSLAPGRLLDTRPGMSTVDGHYAGYGYRPAGTVTELHVTSRAGVPADASSVVLNVTVTEPQQAGYVTVFPCGTPVPNASNLNFTAGQTVPNAVIAKVGTNGNVCLFTSPATQLIADVNGYSLNSPTSGSLAPGRLLDTRPGMS